MRRAGDRSSISADNVAMAHAVFLRAVNVGGANVFRPAQFATAMKRLDVVNIGAAGTFVVRSGASRAEIKKAFEAKLPHDLAMAIRPGREVLGLIERDPFNTVTFSKDHRGWVGVLIGRPTRPLPLPHIMPADGDWLIRCDALDGAFALGQWRRHPTRLLTPANPIEKALGVPVTVRWWETIEKVARALAV
jgi:hypothetical protein